LTTKTASFGPFYEKKLKLKNPDISTFALNYDDIAFQKLQHFYKCLQLNSFSRYLTQLDRFCIFFSTHPTVSYYHIFSIAHEVFIQYENFQQTSWVHNKAFQL